MSHDYVSSVNGNECVTFKNSDHHLCCKHLLKVKIGFGLEGVTHIAVQHNATQKPPVMPYTSCTHPDQHRTGSYLKCTEWLSLGLNESLCPAKKQAVFPSNLNHWVVDNNTWPRQLVLVIVMTSDDTFSTKAFGESHLHWTDPVGRI